jgi:cell division protein FtsN
MRNAARLNKKQISGPDKISKDTPPETQLQAEVNTAVQGTSQANRFFIITGSFPNEKEAEQAVEVLKGKGYADASVVGTNSSGSYRIACKSYPTGEAASKELPEIKKSLNSTAWIFEKT